MTAGTGSTAALAAIIAIAAGAPAFAQAPAPSGALEPPAAGTSPPVRLSDEATLTRWVHAVARASAYEQPSANARQTGRLRLLTEDGFPEVYLALAGWQDAEGTTWIQVRLPQRPNNVTGWVRRGALGELHVVRKWLVVDRGALRLTLYDRGTPRFRARVGIGAPGTPTPAGSFWIREKFHVRRKPLYGTRAIGTAAYSNALTDWPGGGVVGLHGTSAPGLIPGRPSHGCIRLRNRDIERLYALTPIGTPLLIE